MFMVCGSHTIVYLALARAASSRRAQAGPAVTSLALNQQLCYPLNLDRPAWNQLH